MTDRRKVFAIVFLLVLGARWGVIARFGSPVPYANDWFEILHGLLVPRSLGQMPWAELYAPTGHGHRLVFTRLWEIGWYALTGAVNRPLVMQANAGLISAAAAFLAAWMAEAAVRPGVRWFLVGTVAAAWMAPIGYANLLWGYQSQFYFLILFIVMAAHGLLADSTSRRTPWTAWVLALAAPGTMGSGFLEPALLLATLAGLRWCREGWSRKIVGLGSLALLALAVGRLLLPLSAFKEEASARPLLSFVQAGAWPEVNLLGPVFQWPGSARYLPAFVGRFPSEGAPAIAALSRVWREVPLLAVVLWAGFSLVNWWPWLRQGGDAIRRRHSLSKGLPLFWLFLGGWTLVQLLGVSCERTYGPYVPTRYLDLTMLGFTVNLALAWTGGVLRGFERRAWTGLLAACLLATVAGTVAVELPRRAEESHASLKNVQAYLATGDVNRLRNQPVNHLPVLETDRDRLMATLDDPNIRALLRPAAAPAFDAAPTGILRLPFRFWWAPWAAALLLLGVRPRRAA